MAIPQSEWRWYGSPGHLCVADSCRFHLCTEIGDVIVSTVGEYVMPTDIKNAIAEVNPSVRERRFEEIGYGRLYETMVFRCSGKRCVALGCACGMPEIDFGEIDFGGYNDAGSANRGHVELCAKWAACDGIAPFDDEEVNV